LAASGALGCFERILQFGDALHDFFELSRKVRVAESVDDLNATFSKGTPCITRMALRQEDRRRKIVLP
jgi:hypothetical protein